MSACVCAVTQLSGDLQVEVEPQTLSFFTCFFSDKSSFTWCICYVFITLSPSVCFILLLLITQADWGFYLFVVSDWKLNASLAFRIVLGLFSLFLDNWICRIFGEWTWKGRKCLSVAALSRKQPLSDILLDISSSSCHSFLWPAETYIRRVPIRLV